MMIIYKNGQQSIVPNSAYKRLFRPYGWTTSPGGISTAPTESVEDGERSEPGEHTPDTDLASMSDEALKQYAALLGLKTKNFEGRDELMAAIREVEN